MYKSGNFFLLTFFFLLIKMGNAQTGKIKYRLEVEEYATDDKLEAVLYSADTVRGGTTRLIGTKIFSLADSLQDIEFTFDSLTEAYYTITLLVNHVQRFSHINIEVKPGKTTDIYQYYTLNYVDTEPEDSAIHLDFSPFILYGGNETEGKEVKPIQASITAGFNSSPYWSLSKNFAFGALIGSSVSYTSFEKDTVPGKKFERYFGLDFNTGLFFRINSGNAYTKPEKGFIIDAGAYYALPLLFRHAYSFNNTRIQDRWIHQYTNFYAFARVGIKPVSIQAEYRLCDFILGNYPELPKFRVGIALLINQE
jgi:hypothetical protein